MRRIRDARQREAIEEARLTIAPFVADRLDFVDFFAGVDPLWAGLHSAPFTLDGRSFHETACCLYPWHGSDGRVTIALPTFEPPWVVVHELGHALDFLTDFRHDAKPVTAYETTNRMEAFAGAFTARFYRWGKALDEAYLADRPTVAFFDGLFA